MPSIWSVVDPSFARTRFRQRRTTRTPSKRSPAELALTVAPVLGQLICAQHTASLLDRLYVTTTSVAASKSAPSATQTGGAVCLRRSVRRHLLLPTLLEAAALTRRPWGLRTPRPPRSEVRLPASNHRPRARSSRTRSDSYRGTFTDV